MAAILTEHPPGAATNAPPSPVKAWLLATRPATLGAAVAPVLVGTALAAAAGKLAVLPALAALLGSIFIQIGTNLSNDYFDFRKGADTDERLGPKRASAQGWIRPEAVLAGAMVCFAASAVCGGYLVLVGGWAIAIIGVVSILSGIAYTGGPYPLGYHGLGDIFVFIFFGPVAVLGTYWVQAGELSLAVALASIPMGLLITAIIVVNNLRDRHTDAKVGKRTLAVRLGAAGVRLEYLALLIASWAVLPIAVALGVGGLGWLLPFVAAPVGVVLARRLYALDGAALNPLLGATARLGLLFALLLSVGVLL